MIIIVPSDFKTISNPSLAIVTSSLSFFKMRGIEVSSGATPRRFPPFIQSTDLDKPSFVFWARERPKGYAERLALIIPPDGTNGGML